MQCHPCSSVAPNIFDFHCERKRNFFACCAIHNRKNIADFWLQVLDMLDLVAIMVYDILKLGAKVANCSTLVQ